MEPPTTEESVTTYIPDETTQQPEETTQQPEGTTVDDTTTVSASSTTVRPTGAVNRQLNLSQLHVIHLIAFKFVKK